MFREPLGPITLAEHEYRRYENRRAANLRPHCQKCGRFVPKATLRTSYGYWGDDWDQTGVCVTHGRVHTSWERT